MVTMKKFKAKIYLNTAIEGCKQDFNGFYIEGFFSCSDHQAAPYFPAEGLYRETDKGFIFIPLANIKYIDGELTDEEQNGNNENICEP